MKQYIVSIFIMLIFNTLSAQSIKISGILANSQTNEPIPFANAAIYTPADTLFVRGASTDLDGHFTLTGITPGTYLMRITMVGFQPLERTLQVQNSINLGRLLLTPGAMLSEVQVTSSRPVFTMDGEKNIYNTSDDPSIQSGTVVDALQNAPGIEVDAEGNVRLRGVQEVSIWINGRECRMNEEALKQYLKTLPASSLKRIEVITNPSARYGGGRPVVNIVTQGKSRENQFLSLGLNSNTKPQLAPWLSYIFSNEHWDIDIYASFDYNNDTTTTTGSDLLHSPSGDTSRLDDFRRSLHERSTSTFFSFDIAYHPDSLTSYYFWLGPFAEWSNWSANCHTTRIERLYNPGDYTFNEHSSKLRGTPSFGLMDGIWYEHMFDDSTGHTLMFGYYGSASWRDSIITLNRSYTYLPQHDIQYQSHHIGHDYFHAIEAAYLYPFGTRDTATGTYANELEAGFEGFYEPTSATISVDTTGSYGTALCSWLSSQQTAHTGSASLYASLLHRWGKISVKGGLRGEVQSGLIRYPDAPQHDFSNTRFCLVPSLHITYTTPNESALSLSYTRRMSLPQTADYTTRRIYQLDHFDVGNPLLRNSLTHNIECKFDRYIDGLGSLGVNLFYSAHTDQQGALDDVVYDDQIFHRIITFTQPVNIGSSWNSGIDLHAVYRPNAFLNIRLNSSLFYDYLDLQYRYSNDHYRNGLWCCSIRLNAWVKLWNSVQLFGNAYYTSPTQSLFSTNLSRKGVDLGTNADLCHRRLSVNLSINDLFNWNQWSTHSANPIYSRDTDVKLKSRYVSLAITVRFGQMDLEKSPRKSAHRLPPDE